YAGNLVPDDTNSERDVFVRDRVTGGTTRVSVSSTGGQGNDFAGSAYPCISADGRYVAFGSGASNLVVGDTNGVWDVFVHDRVTGATTRVSVDSSGTQGNGHSGNDTSYESISISADGRYVAFWSGASNLVANDTNMQSDVFVHDRVTGATTRVSVDSSGAQGNASSHAPSISSDGRYVAFESNAGTLVANDTNGQTDIFVHDRATGATTRVSVHSSGSQGDNTSNAPSISSDGRYVAFSSFASNLVGSDTNGMMDVFVHDSVTGATTRASVDSSGAQGNASSSAVSVSSDGRFVAFSSYASNLVAGDTNGTPDVFVHDSITGATTRVSIDSSGAQGDATSPFLSISSDGRCVAFESDASNLVAGDSNGQRDVFIRDLVPLSANDWLSFDSGIEHVAGVRNDGTLWAWGGNYYGQVGDGSATTRTVPVQVGTSTDWLSVATGAYHSIAIKSDGSLYAWGRNDSGQIGIDATGPPQATPSRVGTGTDWVAVAGGHSFTVAIKRDGTLWTWGANQTGQLGSGSISATPTLVPTQVGGDTDWASVSGAYLHALAVKQDGSLWTWGANFSGQLGLGSGAPTVSPSPSRVGTGTDWTMAVGANQTSVALRRDGTLWTWGADAYGQLGDGLPWNQDSNAPGQVETDSDWVSIGCGGNHVVAVKRAGTLWAWGRNNFGQCGYGAAFTWLLPAPAGTDTDWVSVVALGEHTVALKRDGTLWGAGANYGGQIGDGTTTDRFGFTAVVPR
ncbi:MAG TPA: hypothetical protein VF902_03240, partial [Coriobacteriia bacterium]